MRKAIILRIDYAPYLLQNLAGRMCCVTDRK